MTKDTLQTVSGRVLTDQALVASLPEPVPVSALSGDDPSRGPEMERLVERMCGDQARPLLGFHVEWGPDAASLTAEERAAALNAVFDEMDHPVLGLAAELDGEAMLHEDGAHPQYDVRTGTHLPLTGHQKREKQRAELLRRAAQKLREMHRDSDGSGEAGETRSVSTEGDSAGPQGHRPTSVSIKDHL